MVEALADNGGLESTPDAEVRMQAPIIVEFDEDQDSQFRNTKVAGVMSSGSDGVWHGASPCGVGSRGAVRIDMNSLVFRSRG